MTDRIFSLTVALDKDIREDDVEPIVNAIKQIRHIADVDLNVSDIQMYTAYSRLKIDLLNKILDLFSEKNNQ